MRKEDFNNLKQPYKNKCKDLFDHRFESAIGADVPSAEKLVEEIFNDLDINSFGIRWWTSLPTQERILISDYLYQCVNGIEENLVEARLHLLEWIDAREKYNDKIADVVSIDGFGHPEVKMPPSRNAQDDLLDKLEEMNICGFFRAVGSSLDCLGATIIGVLALPIPLRRSDIRSAEKELNKIQMLENRGSQIQLDFKDLFEKVKKSAGPEDWLKWADQYRNMFVHRGRRYMFRLFIPRENRILDSKGNRIPRAKSTTHLAKYPDRSDAEALIKGNDIQLDEDAEITLKGIFKSVRELNESLCERLLKIWEERRNNPSLLEQPSVQWGKKPEPCKFTGYDKTAEPFKADELYNNPISLHRILAASLEDKQRNFWSNSDLE